MQFYAFSSEILTWFWQKIANWKAHKPSQAELFDPKSEPSLGSGATLDYLLLVPIPACAQDIKGLSETSSSKKLLLLLFHQSTLVSRIIMQDGIKGQAGKIPKINKRAGWNKAVQDGKYQFLLVKIKVFAKKFPKLINVQDGIHKLVQDGLLLKKNKVLLHNYSWD